MLETISSINSTVNGIVWGVPAMVLIFGVGLYLSIRTGFLQFRKFGTVWQNTIGKLFHRSTEAGHGAVTPFQAVCTALAATVGTGNIAGVAGAIAIGGPGAVFWMWISALLGMVTKYSEVTLAVHYRQKNKHGDWVGGPMYYIQNGLGKKWKWLGVLFAIFGIFAVFGTGNATQVNTIVASIDTALISFGVMEAGSASTLNLILGIVITILVGLILLGGIKRIGHVAERLVPIMALLYVVLGLGVIIVHIGNLPAAFSSIIKGAFNPTAVTGGVVGAMFTAVQKGVARGIFSNEAGLGSAPIAAAAAQTNSPVRQGLVSMTGTFIDTIIICTLTGLSIVLTGAWQVEGLEGVQVTTYAFQHGLPFPAQFSSFILMLCLVFFAFTTILGWDYYSERCLEYLSGGNMKHVKIFRWIYILAVFIGPYMTVSAVWTIADIFNGLMAIPNMIALFALSGVIVKETRAFFQHAKEEALAEHRSFEEVCEENLNEEEAPAN